MNSNTICKILRPNQFQVLVCFIKQCLGETMIEDGRTPISKALKTITITRSSWQALNDRIKDLEERMTRIEKGFER
jgi:hypothetical protein